MPKCMNLCKKLKKNRVKDAMNNALIAIGMRNDELKQRALAAASKIGKVKVNNGDSPFDTPDAIDSIKETKNGTTQ